MDKMPCVGILREKNINPWEMQNYIPLKDRMDIVLFMPNDNGFDITGIDLPVYNLNKLSETMDNVFHPVKYIKRAFSSHFEKVFYYPNEIEKKAHTLNILHTVDLKARMTYTGAYLKRKHGFRLIVTVWENIPFLYKNKPRWQKMRSFILQRADGIIAVTHGAKEALLIEGVPEHKITLIHYGIDVNAFKPLEREAIYSDRFRIKDKEKIILFIGRLVPEKGIYQLLFAARYLLSGDMGFPVKVFIVGTGRERDLITQLIREWGLEGKIVLIPYIPYRELPHLYNLADIFVLPSLPTSEWQEQFGMVLLEAMASGKAIVGSTSGAIPEVLGDAGLLVPSGDWIALANVLKRLLEDETLRNKLGTKAADLAKEKFDSRKIAQQIYLFYKKFI